MSVSTNEIPPRCWAEIDLAALRRNARACRSRSGRICRIMAIVKADAYGHGLGRVVTALAAEVDWFGVANVEEAIRARVAAGSEIPILILSPATPGEVEAIVSGRFSASISTLAEVETFAKAAKEAGVTARLHAVADTGMGRMGSAPPQFPDLVEAILQSPHCDLEGVETHFPSADEDVDFTRGQIETFRQLIGSLNLDSRCEIHLGNSAGLIGFHDETPFATLARPGLALYGLSPLSEESDDLEPALSLKSRVTLVREIPAGTSISYGRTFVSDRPMRVATLGLGYGDGYPRHLSGNETDVLVHGSRCRLLGRVTMDQIVVDVSEVETPVESGDEVVLIGKQGDKQITAHELARQAETIPWEILTGITSRVERVYVGG
ncbi:MAG: alanine racemase [Verrucomicrobiota bacterium]